MRDINSNTSWWTDEPGQITKEMRWVLASRNYGLHIDTLRGKHDFENTFDENSYSLGSHQMIFTSEFTELATTLDIFSRWTGWGRIAQCLWSRIMRYVHVSYNFYLHTLIPQTLQTQWSDCNSIASTWVTSRDERSTFSSNVISLQQKFYNIITISQCKPPETSRNDSSDCWATCGLYQRTTTPEPLVASLIDKTSAYEPRST